MEVMLPFGTLWPENTLDGFDMTELGIPETNSTPTTSTPPEPSSTEDACNYEELTRKHTELQALYVSAQGEITKLQAQNEYWKGILRNAEKGLKIKLNELKTLQSENTQLKQKNAELSQRIQVDSGSSNRTGTAQNVDKRIRHLEDQVRARDLVIHLMKREESERREAEMQSRLDEQRQTFEAQLTESVNMATPSDAHGPMRLKKPIPQLPRPLRRSLPPVQPQRRRGRPRTRYSIPSSSEASPTISQVNDVAVNVTPTVNQSQQMIHTDTHAPGRETDIDNSEPGMEMEVDASLEALFTE